MPLRYIRHLALDTGDQRDSHRAEVAADILPMLRRLLDRALTGERVPIPGDVEPRCTLTATAGRGRALLVTVWGPPYDARGATVGDGVPLVTFGVAPTSLASATLWREWLGTERDDRTPRPPWCAARIHPTLAVYPIAAEWLGDFERCVAWAWVAKRDSEADE